MDHKDINSKSKQARRSPNNLKFDLIAKLVFLQFNASRRVSKMQVIYFESNLYISIKLKKTL